MIRGRNPSLWGVAGVSIGVSIASACSDGRSCIDPARAEEYSLELRDVSDADGCSVPSQLHVKFDELHGSWVTTTGSSRTHYAVERDGCDLQLQIQRFDGVTAQALTIEGALVGDGNAFRGLVSVELSELEADEMAAVNPAAIETAERTTLCTGTARASLVSMPVIGSAAEEALAGSGG